jgi:hypothetical protein
MSGTRFQRPPGDVAEIRIGAGAEQVETERRTKRGLCGETARTGVVDALKAYRALRAELNIGTKKRGPRPGPLRMLSQRCHFNGESV